MARLALTVVGMAIGAALAFETGGMSIALGMQLGALAGGLVGMVAFPGKGVHTIGPRVTDMQVASSAPGAVIPVCYGSMRLGGQIIWSPGIKETTTTTSQSAKGGPSVTQTTYTYSVSFAAAFCQGPATVSRIWGDSKLIYDKTGSGAVLQWDSTVQYSAGSAVSYEGLYYKANSDNINVVPYSTNPITELVSSVIWTAYTPVTSNAVTTYPIPTLYIGNEAQLPDPLMVSHDGATLTPAYRGVCYIVYEDFPLANFGNRLPNIRAEVNSDIAESYPFYTFPMSTIHDGWQPGSPQEGQESAIIDSNRGVGFFISTYGHIIQRINLLTNEKEAEGLITPTMSGYEDANQYFSNTQGVASSWVIDGDGYLWTVFNVNFFTDLAHLHYDSTGPQGYYLTRIDPYTFRAVSRTAVSCQQTPKWFTYNHQFPATPNGINISPDKSIAYINAGDGTTLGGNMAIYGVGIGGSPIGHAGLPGGAASGFGYPVVADDGSVWTITVDSGGSATWYICKVRATEGTTDPLKDGSGNALENYSEYKLLTFGYGWNSSDGTGNAFFYNATDASLIILTTTGKILKWDVKTKAVIDSVGGLNNFAFFTGVSFGTESVSSSIAQYKNIISSQNRGLLTEGLFFLPGPFYGGTVFSAFSTASGLLGYTVTNQTQLSSFITSLTGSPSLVDSLTASAEALYVYRDASISAGNTGSILDFANYLHAGGNSSLQSARAGVPCCVYRSFRTSDLSIAFEYNLANWLGSDLSVSISPLGSLSPAFDPSTASLLFPGSLISSTVKGYHIYLDRIGGNGLTADAIVLDVCQRAGMDPNDVDVTQLASIPVRGYPVTSLQPGKDTIATLAQYGFFDGRETDFKLQFIPRGQSPSLTIPESDLGLVADKAKLTETIGQEQDIPKSVEILYIDPNQDYQQGHFKKIRHHKTTKTINQTSISLPIVMTPGQAAQLADRLLWTADAERRQYKTNLYKAAHMLLDPCDVLQFVYDGVTLTGRVSASTIGQNYATALEITSEDSNNYLSSAVGTGSGGFVGQTLNGLALTTLWILDVPLLRDEDADASGTMGYYFAMVPTGGGSWGAGVLYDSSDNTSFNQRDASASQIAYGLATTALGDCQSPFVWDNANSLTVNMILGSGPTSDTDLNVLNGTNAAILYPSLEIIQYGGVVQNGDGTYTVSHLLRGRRGTEWARHAHVAGEIVLFPLINGGLKHEQVSLSLFNQLRYYKAITVGADLNSGLASQAITLKGRDLMPYAPAQFTGAKSGSDIVLTWVRRTRIGGELTDGTGSVPLNEDSESYDVEILSAPGGTVKRTFSGLTSPTVTYTSAQQTTDFGSTQSDIAAKVYQNSAQVGRGFATENDHALTGAAPVSGGSDATSINGVPIGTPVVAGTYPVFDGSNINWQLPSLNRQTFTKTTASLANNAAETGVITMVKAFMVLAVSTDKDARVELYSTTALRDADASRPSSADPTGESGVICDVTTGSDLSHVWIMSEAAVGANMESTPVNTIASRVTNLSGSTGTVTFNITVIPFEQ